VQGEPLRVKPERWLASDGETVRLFATLQNSEFQPVAGATVEGEWRGADGASRPVTFTPRAAGTYVAELRGLPPGRFTVSARAASSGRTLGTARTEFAVDAWSLEAARTEPDSSMLASMATAGNGEWVRAENVERWARGVSPARLARERTVSTRLWESPWLFACVVGLLGIEWAWRRRRGLP
jgi:hypothetical protein